MRYFTASGLWYLDDDLENRVAGTLRYSEHGLQLKLMGSFKGGWSPTSESYPLILGVASKNPYGEFVTLIDCLTTQKKWSSAGIVSEKIACNRAIAGRSHLRPDHDEFRALELKISHLDEWFRRRGIVSNNVPGESFGLDVRYRKPESVRFSIGQESVILGTVPKWRSSLHKLNIIEEAHLYIDPLPCLTAEKLHAAYVYPIQDLLSFATDTPNAVEETGLRRAKAVPDNLQWSDKYHYITNPIFRPRGKKKHLTPSDMLFTFDEAEEAGLNVFENWLEFTKRHKTFCTVYFAMLYAPSKYLDQRFLGLMSAFSLLSASLGEVSQRTTHFLEEIETLSESRFTEEERALLGHALPTGPEIEMPFHLLRLLEENRTIMSQIVGDDFPSFVKYVSDTLAYVQRRSTAGSDSPRLGTPLHYATEKLRILIKLVMLKELGFKEDQVARSIERNVQYVSIQSSGC